MKRRPVPIRRRRMPWNQPDRAFRAHPGRGNHSPNTVGANGSKGCWSRLYTARQTKHPAPRGLFTAAIDLLWQGVLLFISRPMSKLPNNKEDYSREAWEQQNPLPTLR